MTRRVALLHAGCEYGSHSALRVRGLGTRRSAAAALGIGLCTLKPCVFGCTGGPWCRPGGLGPRATWMLLLCRG
eukprot:365326-Chlamydomonas_euryale.AAC.8